MLDGYPKNIVQLLCLNDFRINPSLIVELECPNDVIMRRFKEKKVDPISGEVFDKFNPCEDQEVLKRLKENPNETAEVISKR